MMKGKKAKARTTYPESPSKPRMALSKEREGYRSQEDWGGIGA